jgi:hypothetical protein
LGTTLPAHQGRDRPEEATLTERESNRYTATYSPDDNKLRLYALTRLPADIYARVKTAGFIWAPKQDLFVAPAWTPDRADLLVELAGEIDDEDTSLVDRAEVRADRFSGYRDRRKAEAEAARAAVAAIADNIPLGQPILVGHHSEKHARKDAERIQNGMRRAVKLWETSNYWTARAAGALRAAKYKERPDVRARRIKALEADKRREEKRATVARAHIRLWAQLGNPYKDGRPCDAELERVRALQITNYGGGPIGMWSGLNDGKLTPREAQRTALKGLARTIASARRWVQHIDNRLAYERAMLEDGGGLPADRFALELGGRVLARREWSVILRINRKAGAVVSVRTTAPYCSLVSVEDIKDYQPPAEGVAAKVKAATKLPPLCNYPGPDCVEMTKAEFQRLTRATDFAGITTVKATAEHGAHRRRRAPGTVAKRPYWETVSVYLTDEKRKDPPPATPTPTPDDDVQPRRVIASTATTPSAAADPAAEAFAGLKEQLRAGVQVVTADQLFPTPAILARRVAELADVVPGQRVLEPSAGTGALVEALRAVYGGAYVLTAVEINPRLSDRLRNVLHTWTTPDVRTSSRAPTSGPSIAWS